MIFSVILTFIATFLLIFTCYHVVKSAKESPNAHLKRRLRRMARESGTGAMPETLKEELLRDSKPFDSILGWLPFTGRMELLLDRAGLKISAVRFLLIVCAAALTCFMVIFMLRHDYILASAIAVAVVLAAFIAIIYLKSKRIEKFTEQLPDTLGIMSRSLRASHTLISAMDLVGQEMPEPTKELFRTAFEQQRLGLGLSEALVNMSERIESLDLRFLVIVITLNREIGGNLAETFDKLAETIRERIKIRRQVRVYTAQGRLSGYFLAILPIVMFIVLGLLMPGYEDPLTKQTKGQIILAIAAVGQLLGFLVIRKIIKIRI